MKRSRLWLVTSVAAVISLAATPAAIAGVNANETIAEGVEYTEFTAETPHGDANAHLLTVDASNPDVRLGTMYSGSIAKADVLTSLADGAKAVAGVNGDFFNINETEAPSGPMVVKGKDMKAAVPGAQRQGPTPPPGVSNARVFGVTTDGEVVVDELNLDGKATGPDGDLTLDGFNQYAITVDGVGVFNSDWGVKSRKRAVCGTDEDLEGPCSERTREVEVTDGKVTGVSDEPGEGEIKDNQQFLVARDEGVSQLEGLSEGDEVSVDHQLVSASGADFDTAMGAMPLALDGTPLELNDDPDARAPRTAMGISEDGDTVYMLALDGRGSNPGANLKSLADVMMEQGAHDVVNLDGGGSTTMVGREGDQKSVSVLNKPAAGEQRPIPTGFGVFAG